MLSFKEQLFQKVSINKMVVSHFHDKVQTEQIIRKKRIKATSTYYISGGRECVTGKKAQVANFTGGEAHSSCLSIHRNFLLESHKLLEFQRSYVLIQLVGLI